MAYWSAVDILKQLSGELGLPVQTTVVSADNPQGSQLLAALNSAGNELMLYYPWAQFTKQWVFNTVSGQDTYDIPSDWRYFRDQTAWDQTNQWPLAGPKSPQEWAYLKGSLTAGLPHMRFRTVGNQVKFHPVPGDSSFRMSMEYISKDWVNRGGSGLGDMVVADGDLCMYDQWLLIKFVKLKFFQLKGFDSKAVEADFMRVYESLTGKDTGGSILSLTRRPDPQFLGAHSIPDGSWNV